MVPRSPPKNHPCGTIIISRRCSSVSGQEPEGSCSSPGSFQLRHKVWPCSASINRYLRCSILEPEPLRPLRSCRRWILFRLDGGCSSIQQTWCFQQHNVANGKVQTCKSTWIHTHIFFRTPKAAVRSLWTSGLRSSLCLLHPDRTEASCMSASFFLAPTVESDATASEDFRARQDQLRPPLDRTSVQVISGRRARAAGNRWAAVGEGLAWSFDEGLKVTRSFLSVPAQIAANHSRAALRSVLSLRVVLQSAVTELYPPGR